MSSSPSTQQSAPSSPTAGQAAPEPGGEAPRAGVLAPFAIRSYRAQWSADILSAWGFEMETLIIAWLVLVQTDSVLAVTVVGALRFLGTLTAPFAGVLADRVPRRHLLLGMRLVFATVASGVTALAFADAMVIGYLFAVAAISGLLRPAEMMIRQSLVADTVPTALLTNALGFTRTTMDSARIAGALAGAGALSLLGAAPAWFLIALFYWTAVGLTVRIEAHRTAGESASPWEDLKAGFSYVRRTPVLLVIMGIAFLVNYTAFPIMGGLMPIIARDVYGFDENGLATLITAAASGALVGSLVMALVVRRAAPVWLMFSGIAVWHVLIAAFGLVSTPWLAYPLLFGIGAASSGGMIAMSVVVMSHATPAFRGRVMGARMLAVYGLPVGLLVAGVLIERFGITATLLGNAALGLGVVLLIASQWSRWTGASAG